MPVKKVKTKVKKPKVSSKPVAEKKVNTPRVSGLSVPVYSLAGRAAGQMSLPKEVFGLKVNKALLTQAIRVYSTNQKQMLAKTKTRGQVKASKAKIYRQKGTGRARHGAITAPIFVGGGIAFGPTVRKVRLDLPKRMKKSALFSALSSKMNAKNIVGLTGLEKATGKTKEIVKLMLSVPQFSDKNKQISGLIVIGSKTDNVVRAVRNISGLSILPVNLINAYEVLKYEILLITKEAVESFGQVKPEPKEQK